MQNDSQEPPPLAGDSIVPFLRARMRAFLRKSLSPHEVERLMKRYDRMKKQDDKS